MVPDMLIGDDACFKPNLNPEDNQIFERRLLRNVLRLTEKNEDLLIVSG
jgi:hypothetical protein